MKKRIQDFFESEETVSPTYRERIQTQMAPFLEKHQEVYELESKAEAPVRKRVTPLAALKQWLRRTRLPQLQAGWVPLAAAAGVAIAVFVVVEKTYLSPRQVAITEPPAPIAEAPQPTPPAVVVVPEPIEPPKEVVPLPRPEKKTQVARIKKPMKKPQLISPKAAVAFVEKLDLFLVLHVVKDLDVLMRWSGQKRVSLLPSWLFPLVNSAYAADEVERLRLDEEFLDEMLKVYPRIPARDQAKYLDSLGHLRSIWKAKKPILAKNYETWEKAPAKQRETYQKNFATWKKLSPQSKTQVLDKYERWKLLSEAEKNQIRRRVLGSRG